MEIEDGGDEKVRKEKLHMMRWTKRETHTHTRVLSPLMIRNGSIRIWQPLEKTSIPWSSFERPLLALKGTERSRGRCLSKAAKDEAHQLETHDASAVHQGDRPPEGCEEAPAEPTISPIALSGPRRQTSTWITETLTLTGNSSKKGTAEFRWGFECVRESNSPRQFPLKCSQTRPINSNWKGTTTVCYQVFEMLSL